MRKIPLGLVSSIFFGAIGLAFLIKGNPPKASPNLLLSWTDQTSETDPMTMLFAANDELVSVHSDEQIRTWNLSTQGVTKKFVLAPFLGEGAFARLPVISPDGKWGAVQGIRENISYKWDKRLLKPYETPSTLYRNSLIFVWSMSTGRLISLLPAPSEHANVVLAFSNDGNRIAVGGETDASLQDHTHEKLPSHAPRGVVEVWDWKSHHRVWKSPMRVVITGLSWESNGRLAVGGGNIVFEKSTAYDGDGELSVWNPINGRRLNCWRCGSQPRAVVFSRDGKWLVIAEGGGGLSVWNMRGGGAPKLFVCPVKNTVGSADILAATPPLDQVVISGDSRLVAGLGFRGGVRVWKLAEGTFIGSYDTIKWKKSRSEPTDNPLALSPDGKWLAVGSSSTREIVLHPMPSH